MPSSPLLKVTSQVAAGSIIHCLMRLAKDINTLDVMVKQEG